MVSPSQLENGVGGKSGNHWNIQTSVLLGFPWQPNKSKTNLSVPTKKYVFTEVNLKYFFKFIIFIAFPSWVKIPNLQVLKGIKSLAEPLR